MDCFLNAEVEGNGDKVHKARRALIRPPHISFDSGIFCCAFKRILSAAIGRFHEDEKGQVRTPSFEFHLTLYHHQARFGISPSVRKEKRKEGSGLERTWDHTIMGYREIEK